MMEGTLRSINVSNGGVPKTPRPSAAVRTAGVEGDRQGDRRYHGGPDRAVSLYSVDLIEALQAEGHPITAGSTGENLTIAGLEWARLASGLRLTIGEVVLELTEPAHPCKKIAASFRGGDFSRLSEKTHPGWSRLYARVRKEGIVGLGDRVVVTEPPLE